VNELKETEIEGKMLLRDTAVRAQPGAQQRPESLHRVDMDLMEAVAIFVTGILVGAVTNRLVLCS
jgi:hypothetical protein